MKTRKAAAREIFGQGFACSQAVVGAFASTYGLSESTACRMACAFGGGMSRNGLVCGAVSGALMVIGLEYGMARPGEREKKDRTYAAGAEFMATFKRRHGSLDCSELLGIDMTDASERKRASDEGLFSTRCPRYVEDAVEILESMAVGESSALGA